MYDVSIFKSKRKEIIVVILVAAALLVAVFSAGYSIGLRNAGASVPDNGNGISTVREQLGTAAVNQREITEGIGNAKERVAHIEAGVGHVARSVEQSAVAVNEAAGLIDSCQQILGRIRNRGQKGTVAH